MSSSVLTGRFQGRETQFHIELLYGALFIGGFAYLVFRVDPRVAAFEGGLVVGYLLRIWEKMSIYERILEEVVSREAEAQVADEVEAQVGEEVAEEVEAQVGDEFESELDERIDEQVAERLDDPDELEAGDGHSA
jgi:hypothetical protein